MSPYTQYDEITANKPQHYTTLHYTPLHKYKINSLMILKKSENDVTLLRKYVWLMLAPPAAPHTLPSKKDGVRASSTERNSTLA